MIHNYTGVFYHRKYAPENSGASEMEVDDASKKESQKSKGDEDTSSDSDTELDAWTAKRLALVEKKANTAKQMEATMKEQSRWKPP